MRIGFGVRVVIDDDGVRGERRRADDDGDDGDEKRVFFVFVFVFFR